MGLAANCGVGLLASIHAESVEELRLKPLWQELLRAEVFRRCVVIRANGGTRSYEVSALPVSRSMADHPLRKNVHRRSSG